MSREQGRWPELADGLRDEFGPNGWRQMAGWHGRGKATLRGHGSVNHHTAGSSRGILPSLAVLTYGYSGLPGPLCNVALGRDNVPVLIADGKANHAGRGGWAGLRYNSSVFGLEVENTGYATGPRAEPWTAASIETQCRIHAVFARVGGFGAHMVPQHKEWAPTRKIDAHSIDGRVFRARIADILAPAVPTPPPTPDPTPGPGPSPTPEPLPASLPPTGVDMFLLVNGVGLFAVVDGVPVAFKGLAEYAAAKNNSSDNVPVMWLDREPGEKLVQELIKKHAAALTS